MATITRLDGACFLAKAELIPSQLEFFKSSGHLLHLQGGIVPRLVTTDDTVDGISMYMEPPHNVFWMHASPSMPDCLKRRVIDTYMILHRAGILHCAVELRHMLIGADGRVTLVDFKWARSTRRVKGYRTTKPHKRDFALELREVKCKLDYQGARAREAAKWARFCERNEYNQEVLRLRQFTTEGGYDGSNSDLQDPIPQDRDEPPLPPRQRCSEWDGVVKDESTRFVCAGASRAAVTAAIASFYEIVQRMEEEDAIAATIPVIPLPDPSIPVTPYWKVLDVGRTPGGSPRKRKRSEDAQSGRPSKRQHQDVLAEQSYAQAAPLDAIITLECKFFHLRFKKASSDICSKIL